MRWAIIGLGNPMRQDDGFGRLLAQSLHQLHPDWPIWEASGETTQLLTLISALDAVVLLDATVGSGPPGTVLRHDATHQPVGLRRGQSSSHGMGLVEAIELARALEQLPSRVILFTAEALAFAHGEPPSPPVQNAIQDAHLLVEHEISCWLAPTTQAPPDERPCARTHWHDNSETAVEGSRHA